ncbi:hypothetical protein FBQ95_15160 [Chloroflexi bacterium CFX3]|nr:hypothetical protein [Chloroflexi bacterium CFX3]
MKAMRFWSVILAVLFIVSVSATPTQAQAGYSITLGDCSITVNQVGERPDEVYVNGVGTSWPTIGTTGIRVPSVTIPVASSGAYLVEVYDYSFSDAEPIFTQLVLVTCGAPPAEPLDPVVGLDDPDLVVDTTVLIVDTDGVIREGQAFARLLRPTYLGNRSIIDIPFQCAWVSEPGTLALVERR